MLSGENGGKRCTSPSDPRSENMAELCVMTGDGAWTFNRGDVGPAGDRMPKPGVGTCGS